MQDYKDIINQIVYKTGMSLIDSKKVNVSSVKNEVLIYLYLSMLAINNDKYDAKFNNLYNCSPELSNLIFLNNDTNYVVGLHNKKIIKSIRNAFVHGSGKITLDDNDLIISNDTRPGNAAENRNTTIKVAINDLIPLLEKVSDSMEKTNNETILTCLEAINKIKSGDVLESKKLGYTMLLTLMLSYNKESLYDKYMNFMDSSLDLSKLKVSNAKLLDDESQSNLKTYYEDNAMVFKSMEDDLTYYKDLLKLAENAYFIEKTESKNKVVWDPNIMSIDEKTGVHIPNSIVMTHLRNAVSHGFMTFDDNGVFFNDYNKKMGRYFDTYVSFEQLNNVFISNYLKEGVKTLVETHENMNDNMYRTQLALSKQSIANYIAYYKTKFPLKSEIEVINYMIDNNKFSAYLYENPECIREFWSYVLPDSSCFLLDYISEYYGMNTADMLKNAPHIWARDAKIGVVSYGDYLKGTDNKYLLAKMLYFKNRCSWATTEEINQSISKEDIEKLSKSTRLASLYTFVDQNYFEQLILGNYINNTTEIERIMCAIVHYDKYVIEDLNFDKAREIDDIDEAYKNSTEYRESLNAYESLSADSKRAFYTFMKIYLGMKMFDFFKNRLSDEKMKNFNNVFNKIFLKSKFDITVMLYLAKMIKEDSNEREGRTNNL